MQWKGKNHTLKDFVGCLLYTWTLKLSISFNVVNSSCKKLWRVLCNWFLCLLQQWHFATKLVTILRWTHGKTTNVWGTKLPIKHSKCNNHLLRRSSTFQNTSIWAWKWNECWLLVWEKGKSLDNPPNWPVEIGQSTLMGGHKLTMLQNPKAPKALLATKLVDNKASKQLD